MVYIGNCLGGNGPAHHWEKPLTRMVATMLVGSIKICQRLNFKGQFLPISTVGGIFGADKQGNVLNIQAGKLNY
jgi:hypothetical protein